MLSQFYFQAKRISLFALLLLLCLPSKALSQTWHFGAAGPNLLTIGYPSGGNPCSVTWYDPDAFRYSNGDIGFLAQSNNPLACDTRGIDSISPARRNSTTLAWQTPASTSCPTLRGLFMTGGFPQNCGYSQAKPGPLGSPSIVKVGSRYFMAFVGGNADYIRGQIYWAVSNDGATWTVYKVAPPPGFNWTPIIGPKYGNPCEPFGMSHVKLVYDPSTSIGPEGGFYLYLFYHHPAVFQALRLETLAYRIPYASADAFGLGAVTGRQLCIGSSSTSTTCSWVRHSGKLVWDYDGSPAEPGDPLLQRQRGMRQMGFGGGDVKHNPQQGNWLHVYEFAGVIYWQTTTSLESSIWTPRQVVDVSSLDSQMASRYPAYQPERYYGGLWYGTLGGRTGMWIYQPVDYAGCSSPFAGLGIVLFGLNYF